MAPSLQTPGQTALGAKTFSPNILQGQATPNISTDSQALSTDVGKERAGKEKTFEMGNVPDCLSRSLRKVMAVVVVKGQSR